jgi:protein TonB
MFALLLALVLTPPAVLPLPLPIDNPDRQSNPTGGQMERFYPESARMRGVEGRATIECTVQAGGGLQDCRVISETPSGEGFGAATIRAATRFRVKSKTADGTHPDGGTVKVTLHWSPPPP